jgi:hypothetical protein
MPSGNPEEEEEERKNKMNGIFLSGKLRGSRNVSRKKIRLSMIRICIYGSRSALERNA